MGMMIVRHKVRDYGQWRPIFDAHAEMQKAAGLSNPRVYHSADSNKSEIVVVFAARRLRFPEAFIGAPPFAGGGAHAGAGCRHPRARRRARSACAQCRVSIEEHLIERRRRRWPRTSPLRPNSRKR